MSPRTRKMAFGLGVGVLVCMLFASLLVGATSRTSSLLDRIGKQQTTLRLAATLADQIVALSGAAAAPQGDHSGFQQLNRISFADDVAMQVGIPGPSFSRRQLETHEGYDRLILTIQYENLSLQQLTSFLFQAEQIPGITVSEISPLTPVPGRAGKWNATVKLSAASTHE